VQGDILVCPELVALLGGKLCAARRHRRLRELPGCEVQRGA